MRVFQLAQNSTLYTCRSYLILGDWNQLEDINTLIDPGTDDHVFKEIDRIYTGCGKVPVEQILLTHNHFDHAASVGLFKKRYGSRVYAWVNGPDVDVLLKDGQLLHAGDDYLEVIHTPGHSSDSVSFYCQSKRLLFSGDTQLRILTSGGRYTKEYLETLHKLSQREIELVYPGHDEPFNSNVRSTILETLYNVRSSQII